MYDIILLEKIICPHCRQEHFDFEFQAKDFSNLLTKYGFPDAIDKSDGKYEINGVCDICTSFIRGKITVENRLFKKISYWVENCPAIMISANIEDALRSTLIESKIIKENINELSWALKALALKVKNKEEISEKALNDLEKIFSFSLQEEKKAVNITAPSYTIVTGTKKYYIILSNEEESPS